MDVLKLEIFLKPLTKIFSDWNWALLDQALVSGTNFVVGIILVRFLGVGEYGYYVLAWMVVQIVLSIQHSLISAPMLSIAPKVAEEEKKSYYSSVTALQLSLVLIVFIAGCFFIFFPDAYKPKWLSLKLLTLITVCLVLVQLQDYFRRLFFSKGIPWKSFCIDFLAYGLQLPALFFVIKNYPEFENALAVIIVCMAISNFLGIYWLDIKSTSVRCNIIILKRHWYSSKWLLGSAILQWLSSNYFLIAAATLLGPATTGAIRASQNLLGLTHILFLGLENIIPIEASRRLRKGGGEFLLKYIIKVSLVLLLGTGAVAIVAASFAETLLSFFYGKVMQESVVAMFWYIPFYIFSAISISLKSGLRSLEHTKWIFISQVVGALFSVTFSKYIIVNHDVNGVMAGMVFIGLMNCIILFSSLISLIKKESVKRE